MKNIIYITVIVLIIAIAGFFMLKNPETTGNAVVLNDEIQEITIGYKNYNYYPQEVYVKSNQPVRIYLDSSVKGCFRDFTIRELGVKKYIETENDYVEFTPSNKGTYVFACSMGMGTGKLIVE